MTRDVKSYVHSIVKQTDCTKEDYDDLFEELFGHVTMIRDEYVDEGYSLEEATDKAMKRFGQEAIIGNELQQSMFPYRRELLYVLAIAGFLLTLGMYMYLLFTMNVALPFELGIGVISNCLILFFAMNTTFRINRRRWLNTALIFHLAVLAYSSYWPINLFYEGHLFFPILMIGVGFLNIGIIFLTALTGPEVGRSAFIHLINIPIGLILSTKALILGFGGMVFGASFLYVIGMGTPVYIWGLIYVIQYKALKRGRMPVVTIALICSVLVVIYSVLSFFFIELTIEGRVAHFLENLIHANN
ncbi:permease prefix domain 1-containing protein [Alkalicoccobacillus porphyridii]|uniref:Uncharacterized protein n=1 Tax=Alkalicoccobacillus porphyridii TaxID=2597270 RepID=A0A553ZXK2_9BACI|nr:permease prefix domain 1-containing protein [Alkalicoccobacillus porphyridii]TSB46125.1 hypothetical protein FN960_12225 [Alkalicoccobacillus porphyridii]